MDSCRKGDIDMNGRQRPLPFQVAALNSFLAHLTNEGTSSEILLGIECSLIILGTIPPAELDTAMVHWILPSGISATCSTETYRPRVYPCSRGWANGIETTRNARRPGIVAALSGTRTVRIANAKSRFEAGNGRWSVSLGVESAFGQASTETDRRPHRESARLRTGKQVQLEDLCDSQREVEVRIPHLRARPA